MASDSVAEWRCADARAAAEVVLAQERSLVENALPLEHIADFGNFLINAYESDEAHFAAFVRLPVEAAYKTARQVLEQALAQAAQASAATTGIPIVTTEGSAVSATQGRFDRHATWRRVSSGIVDSPS